MLLLLVSLTKQTIAQNFFTSFYAGTSHYNGDLGDTKNMLANTHPAFGIGCLYELNDRMLVRLDATTGKISGSDKLSKNHSRNLSFYSNISEISLGFEYVLFNLYDYKVSPYLMIGYGRFRFNPFTKNSNGQVVNLYDLNTEGQGFYKDRKQYKLTETAIPFGGGLQWAITDDKRIAIVVGIRKTTTDYIDDVSTTYIDPVLLAREKGTNSVRMAFRGGEVGNSPSPYPGDGAVRGNPKNNDMYIFSGISYRMRLLPKSRKKKYMRQDKISSRKSKISCPVL